MLIINTSPERQSIDIVRMAESGNQKTLVDQCHTRWVARHDSFHILGTAKVEKIVSLSIHQSW